jgi:MFS family permease
MSWRTYHLESTNNRIYNCFLSLGVAFGLIIDGLISINHPWRVMYYVAVALIGFCTIVVFFFFPETFYARSPLEPRFSAGDGTLPADAHLDSKPPKNTFGQSLSLYTGIHTKESLLRMFLRPIGLILIPPVLWAALVMSVTIGFLVAVASNLAPAFQQFYNMTPWQCGLCNIAAVIGSLLGIWVGGGFSDRVADYFTKRNGGIREPEFRLPAMSVALVTGPLALVFYGVGVNNHIHWILPTIGLGLRTLPHLMI